MLLLVYKQFHSLEVPVMFNTHFQLCFIRSLYVLAKYVQKRQLQNSYIFYFFDTGRKGKQVAAILQNKLLCIRKITYYQKVRRILLQYYKNQQYVGTQDKLINQKLAHLQNKMHSRIRLSSYISVLSKQRSQWSSIQNSPLTEAVPSGFNIAVKYLTLNLFIY